MNCKIAADQERILATTLVTQLIKIQSQRKTYVRLSIHDTESLWYKNALERGLIEKSPLDEKTLVKLTVQGELEIYFYALSKSMRN